MTRDGRRRPLTGPGEAGHLSRVLRALASGRTTSGRGGYRIPGLWADPFRPSAVVTVDPFDHYRSLIESIISGPPVPFTDPEITGGEWSRSAVVYNMMVRTSTAFDHDGDGSLAIHGEGWRETGSFLKAIGILPHIRSLGMNTIHLLPVQEIGLDGRRGNMGSVYAVRDLLRLDETLSEPILGLPVEVQFGAFIDAAHLLGFRVVLEFPLRTVSKDSVWVKDHPDWFYWIYRGAPFHPPEFSEESVRRAGEMISRGEWKGLPAPPESYTSRFSEPPPAGSIRKEGTAFIGRLADGREVTIPGAFADWPPNDHQPVWADITYLKYFKDPGYNYISYNTVRMYDSTLLDGKSANTTLWSAISDVIREILSRYDLDGIMIDMAHALPEALTALIIRSAREINPDVAFWAEDFDRTAKQVEEGYNAVLGGQWACQHRPGDFRDMLAWVSRTPGLLPHLGSPETHNTPRAAGRMGGTRYASYAWAMSNLIPAVPYLHSGLELGETIPVNTGLGFTADEINRYPPEKLGLFSAAGYRWEPPVGMIDMVRKISDLRKQWEEACAPLRGSTCTLLDAGNPAILAFRRSSSDGETSFLSVGNSDMEKVHHFQVHSGETPPVCRDEITGKAYPVVDGFLQGVLDPGQVLFIPLKRGGG